jgi:hypothetical protein
VSILPSHFLNQLNNFETKETKLKSISQTSGQINIEKVINVQAKIGKISKFIDLYVIDSQLPYLLLSLPHIQLFNLEINFKSMKVFQFESEIFLCDNLNSYDPTSYHVQINVPNCVKKNNTNMNVSKKFGDYQRENKALTKFYESKYSRPEKNTFLDKNFDPTTVCKYLSEENEPLNSVNKNENTTHDTKFEEISGISEDSLKTLFKQPSEVMEILTPEPTSEDWHKLTEILEKHNDIFSQNKYDVGKLKFEPQRIHLTTDLPIALRPYRASHADNVEIKKQIEELLEAGFIRPSHSPYAAPVTLAHKKGEGKTRLCIDFRKINSYSKQDSEPIPRIDDLLDQLTHANYFSTLDLTSGYWHIAIHEQDTEKLAFTTNFGLYEFVRLPFGWRNAPSVFQRAIRQILNKYQIKYALNYFDDIIIFSQNFNEHVNHLEEIFKICKQENIKLKKSKCQFAQKEIKFLGYEISHGKYTPHNTNIETIKKLLPPRNVKDLQRFLGSINVYQKFIKDYAKLRVPLNKLLKKDTKWFWSEECQQSFQKLKDILISKPVLTLFNPNYPCHLYVDASQEAIAAVLKQKHPDGTLHPIAFHSRQLKQHERNYAITELECLAIIDAIDKFHCYLHGKKFTIYSDHSALQYLKSVKNLTGRLFRWSLKLSMYDYEVIYIKGTSNHEADMLSRNPISHFVSPYCYFLSTDEIIKGQKSDNVNSRQFKEYDGVLTVKKKNLVKIVVPPSLRTRLITLVHDKFGHPGVKKMLSLISPIYYWQDIIIDISNFVKCCTTCQLNKKSTQKRFGLMEAVPIANEPFDLISIDTIGGFNYYNSTKKYLHLVIDHATRYIWTFPSKSVTSETYANCLKQVFNIQTPKQILSDRNAAFTSNRFRKFLQHNNIKQLLTSAHRPQCNGKNERCNGTIVAKLRCKVNSYSKKIPWTKILEEVTFEYNNQPHSVTGFPPAYLMFGTLPYKSPLPNRVSLNYPSVDRARQIAVQRTIQHHKINKARYDKHYVDTNFKIGDLVMFEEFKYPNSRKLDPPYSGPYTIISKLSNVNFEISKPNQYTGKETDIVHSTRLRHFKPASTFQLKQ